MAHLSLTIGQVAEPCGLDHRTVRGIIRGATTPQGRTVRKLAAGLGVSPDEPFLEPSLLLQRNLDRPANPLVEEVLRGRPDLVEGWTEADFDELYSRVGVGSGLTPQGAMNAIHLTGRKLAVVRKVEVLMESGEAELVGGIVDILYQKAVQDEP